MRVKDAPIIFANDNFFIQTGWDLPDRSCHVIERLARIARHVIKRAWSPRSFCSMAAYEVAHNPIHETLNAKPKTLNPSGPAPGFPPEEVIDRNCRFLQGPG
jgi:hypothetical protein